MVEGEQQYKKSMEALSASNQQLGSSAGKLGDQIQTLGSQLGVQLPSGATKALNGLNGFSVGTVAAMTAAGAAVAAVIKVCKELHEVTMKAAADADELITKSMQTGLSTQTLQQWQYASNLIDVSVETMTGSLTKLTRNMAEAAGGNKELTAAFNALGVSITDGSGELRSAEDVFYDAIDALGQVGNQTERDALAMEIFGKSAQELNPLIIQSSDALKELSDEAEKAGYVLDESQIKKLAEVDDEYQKLQMQIEAAKKQLALEFAPASKATMETFQKAVQTASQALAQSGLVEDLASIVQSVMSLLDTCMSLFDAMPSWLNPLENLKRNLDGVATAVALIADAANVVAGLFTLDFDRVKTALGMNIGFSGGGKMSNLQQLKYQNGVTYNATGNDNWRGGLTWVGESGPELVALPQGSRIYSNQDSRKLGGDTIYNITVANVQQLDEIIDWYESRRTRGRMM